jgi:hypothetical protein
MSKKPLWVRLFKKAGAVLSARVLLALVALAFATSISITPVTYQAEIGSYVNVTNGLAATDQGFAIASANSMGIGSNCSSPVQFNNTPGAVNTSITKGDWVYTVQVNTTTGITANENFTVTLTVGTPSYGPLCIEGATTPATNQIIVCKFDVGNALPTSPYTFGVTIKDLP